MKKYLPVIASIYLAFHFSIMGIWVRMMRESFSDVQQVFIRFLCAGILAIIIFRKQFSKVLLKSFTKQEWAIYISRSFLQYGVGIMLFTVAINMEKIAFVSFIYQLPLALIFAYILFNEKLKIYSVPFLILSIIGLFLLSDLSFSEFHFKKSLIIILCSSAALKLSYLMARYHRKEISNYINITILLCFSSIVPLIILIVRNENIFPSSISRNALIGLIISSTLNIVGLFLVSFVFTNMKAYVAGNILSLEAVFSIFVGLIIYGETYKWLQLFGGMLMIISTIFISLIEREPEAVIIFDEPNGAQITNNSDKAK